MSTAGWKAKPGELLRASKTTDLEAIDPRSTPGFPGGKDVAAARLESGAAELADLQERLHAHGRAGGTRSVLLVLQGMDTAGKGGIVRHSLAGTNPLGVRVTAFTAPTRAEKRHHDFLWRVRRRLPQPGQIAVFDRSHYEDVLVHRVRGLSTPDVVEKRYALIREFEAEAVANGTTILKVMLHISAAEQKERLAERLARADKHWKFDPADIDDRLRWTDYEDAYQIAVQRTTTPDAPWFVVPADRKYYARLAVQRLLIDAIKGMRLDWPEATFDVAAQRARLIDS